MLKIENLTKSFGDKVLFENFCLECQSELILKAPSGWGKTTLMRILMGLEKPDSGAVSGIGRVCPLFQEDRLIPHWNAVQNIRLTGKKDLSEWEILSELKNIGIDEKAAFLPAEKLSGGQKRRAALLRALLAPGDTLLLDEPFAALDEKSAELTAKEIQRLKRNRVVLAAVHEAQGIRLLGWPVTDLTKNTPSALIKK